MAMRRPKRLAGFCSLSALLVACGPGEASGDGDAATSAEWRLADLRMLTFAGENAAASSSAGGDRLICQATRPGESECDQIYIMDDRGGSLQLVSTGQGRTT